MPLRTLFNGKCLKTDRQTTVVKTEPLPKVQKVTTWLYGRENHRQTMYTTSSSSDLLMFSWSSSCWPLSSCFNRCSFRSFSWWYFFFLSSGCNDNHDCNGKWSNYTSINHNIIEIVILQLMNLQVKMQQFTFMILVIPIIADQTGG